MIREKNTISTEGLHAFKLDKTKNNCKVLTGFTGNCAVRVSRISSVAGFTRFTRLNEYVMNANSLYIVNDS